MNDLLNKLTEVAAQAVAINEDYADCDYACDLDDMGDDFDDMGDDLDDAIDDDAAMDYFISDEEAEEYGDLDDDSDEEYDEFYDDGDGY